MTALLGTGGAGIASAAGPATGPRSHVTVAVAAVQSSGSCCLAARNNSHVNEVAATSAAPAASMSEAPYAPLLALVGLPVVIGLVSRRRRRVGHLRRVHPGPPTGDKPKTLQALCPTAEAALRRDGCDGAGVHAVGLTETA